MPRHPLVAWVVTACAFTAVRAGPACAVDVVVDGKPVATLVVAAEAAPAAPEGKGCEARKAGRGVPGDAMAARVLADWFKKMTGAEVPVADVAPAEGNAIYVGAAAVGAGLKLGDIDSPSREGLRVVAGGRKVLLGGQDGASTVKAACRLLETMGCRYYMDSPMGESYPRTRTLRVDDCDLREKPGALYRTIWGSDWSGPSLWKIWNGQGGIDISTGHAWGGYLPGPLFDRHPEYFALRGGRRVRGDWLCTSNPELRERFAEAVVARVKQRGGGNVSISPPDGTGYCECDACRAQDDPNSVEPSSGRVSGTDRYLDFFNAVAKQVAKDAPDSLLSFYCYADYTQAPTRGLRAEPNLVAWVAPLRYCRLHAIGAGNCPSRRQLADLVRDWSKACGRIAYRTYNYNLAECLAPFPMESVWQHDLPFLRESGCVAFNLETLPSWQIYGPHIYLSLRLAYDPAADAAAIMDDYYRNFYGPAAAPMRQYWAEIDRAFTTLDTHAGSFFSLHRVYRPELIARCQKLLGEAERAARDDPARGARVAMHAEGFANAAQYVQLRDALNAGEPAAAKATYDALSRRVEAQLAAGYSNHYTGDFLKRFLGKPVEAAAAAGRVVSVLPDRWKLAYDREGVGETKGYAGPDFDDAGWKSVATYSDTLDAQGLADEKTVLWYRAAFDLPAAPAGAARALFFDEVDGAARVFVNGKDVGGGEKKRLPFAVDVAAALRAGKNVVAVRVDHSKITELFLGGIVRPVYLVEPGK